MFLQVKRFAATHNKRSKLNIFSITADNVEIKLLTHRFLSSCRWFSSIGYDKRTKSIRPFGLAHPIGFEPTTPSVGG